MRSGNTIHLNEEQLLRAVIDETELAGEVRRHLQECATCTEKIALFRTNLQELGENARQHVPAMTKTITLPPQEPAPVSWKLGWLPSFGAAVMAGLVLFVYFLGLEATSPGLPEFQSPEDLLAEEYLMDEIFEMVENPLPDELYQLTGDNSDGFDEEFLKFVVPEIQDNFQS